MKNPKTPPRFATRAIHAGQPADPQTGAVITPIYATSTYAQESPGKHKGLDYGRSHNPTRWAYEKCLALSPRFVKARYNIAIIQLRQRNKTAALEQYNRLRELDPELAGKLKVEIDKS